MKKLIAILGFAASLSQATIIHWSFSNDTKQLLDAKAGDGIYTGKVDAIEFLSGELSISGDGVLNQYAIIDLNTNKFYISTTNDPANMAANALITGSFQFDINNGSLSTGADGYILTDVTVNNTIGSAALAEFAEILKTYPGATYTFSAQGKMGNGQLGTVPEPTTMGLMGMGLLGLMAARRRKRNLD